MNNEQLEQGNILAKQMRELDTEREMWNKADTASKVILNTGGGYTYNTNLSHINFAVLKALTLSTINQKMADIQKQFDAL